MAQAPTSPGCPQCGAPLPAGASACPRCGRPLAPYVPPRPAGYTGRPVVRTPVPAWRSLKGLAIGLAALAVAGIGLYERTYGCGLPPALVDQTPAPIALGATIRGTLSGLHPQRRYSFTLAQATPVVITLGGDFDPYVELYRPGEARPFREDDDSGGALAARLALTLEPGTYEVLVRGFQRSARGDFTLVVVEGSEHAVSARTLAGQVAEATGPAPVPVDAPCTVAIEPAEGGPFNCRVVVTCAGHRVYGEANAGFNSCVVAGGPAGPIRAHDDGVTSADGDPRLDLDTAAFRARVSDEGPGSSWTVTVTLQGP